MVTVSLIGGETKAGGAEKVAIGQQVVGADPRGNGTLLPFVNAVGRSEKGERPISER